MLAQICLGARVAAILPAGTEDSEGAGTVCLIQVLNADYHITGS